MTLTNEVQRLYSDIYNREDNDQPENRILRVSSLDQKLERQLDGIKLDKVFTDKASAKAMLRAFAQFERALIKERQREEIALAKANGVYKVRKPVLNAERIAQLRAQVTASANRTKLTKEFGISRETLYQYIR